MKRLRASWLCVLCLPALSSSSSVFTESIAWQQTKGPYAANVWAIAVNANDHIFSGTDGGGVFRSTDDGESWTAVGLSGLHVLSFAINGEGHIFAGTIFDGVLRSTDNGETWAPVNSGLTDTGSPDRPRYTVSSLIINSNGHIFAGTGEYVQGFKGDGVFRSTDNGESWTQVSPDLTNTIVPALTVSPNGNIFAGTLGRGIFGSTDGGQTWIQTGLDGIDVTSVAISPNGTIFAGIKSVAGINRAGVYRSTDSASWSDTGLRNTGAGVHFIATNSRGHVFAATRGSGVFRSADDGLSWEQVNSGLKNFHVKAISFNSHGDVFIGNSGWVHRSTDNGESWKDVIVGLAGARVRAITVNPAGAVFASNDGYLGGVFRSSDLGESWTNLGFINHCVQALVIGPDGTIFVGSAPGCGGSTSGIFRSTDDGQTWTGINGGLVNPNISTIAINDRGDLFGGTGVLETRNGGEGIFRSIDNGESWTKVNTGLTSLEVWDLAVTPNGDILAGTNEGLFRSRDNAESWTQLSTGLPDDRIPAIAINESNAHIFVAAHGRGVIRSTDNGDSWTRVNQGLSNIAGVLSVTINANGDVVAAGYRGVYYSSNEGENWIEINTGLKNRHVDAVGVSPDGYLFAGGYASSVFRTTSCSVPSHRRLVRRANVIEGLGLANDAMEPSAPDLTLTRRGSWRHRWADNDEQLEE